MKPLVIGIDIGGTNTKFSLVNDKGEALSSMHFKTQADKPFESFCERLKTHLDEYFLEHNINNEGQIVLGIGAPNYSSVLESLVDPPNLSWGSLPIKSILKEYFDYEIYIENDANVAALGEFVWGKAKGVRNFATLTVGTGIGSGLFLNGSLYKGYNGLAAEAGHLVVSSEGRPCNCGGQDHFENYCSVTGIKRTIKDDLNKDLSYFEIVELFNNKDEEILKVLKKTAKYFAVGIYQIVKLIEPELIILSGGGMAVGESFLRMIKLEVSELMNSKKLEDKIKISNLSISDGAILGAAALAMSDI